MVSPTVLLRSGYSYFRVGTETMELLEAILLDSETTNFMFIGASRPSNSASLRRFSEHLISKAHVCYSLTLPLPCVGHEIDTTTFGSSPYMYYVA